MQENEQKLTIKIHRRFRRRRSSVLQRQNTDDHVFYTTLTFQAGTNAILNWIQELFSVINPVLILILKLYYFHTMDNRRQVFFRNHFVQRVCLPSPSRSRPTCLRSLSFCPGARGWLSPALCFTLNKIHEKVGKVLRTANQDRIPANSRARSSSFGL
jgi:hypothetical protein